MKTIDRVLRAFALAWLPLVAHGAGDVMTAEQIEQALHPPQTRGLPTHSFSTRSHCSSLNTSRIISKTASSESAVLNHKSNPAGIPPTVNTT